MLQAVNHQDQLNEQQSFTFQLIDNYIYLYHTKTLVVLPTFPESLEDQMSVNFTPATILSRSAPIYSYSSSGPRTVQVSLSLHRDMMNEVNTTTTNYNVPQLSNEDYIDYLIRNLQSIALPEYAKSEKMVNPPVIAVRFGDEIFCKGIVSGGVGVTYSGPILRTNKYALANISFSVSEIDPYDATTVKSMGSLRGLNLDLERDVFYKTK